jgi:hypothetical protein
VISGSVTTRSKSRTSVSLLSGGSAAKPSKKRASSSSLSSGSIWLRRSP